MSVLENNPKINATIRFIIAALQLHFYFSLGSAPGDLPLFFQSFTIGCDELVC